MTSYGNDGTPDTTIATNYIKQAILNSGQLPAYITDISQFTLSGVNDLYAHDYDVNGSQDHSRMPVTGVNNCIDMINATGSFNVTLLSTMTGSDAAPITETDTTSDETTY